MHARNQLTTTIYKYYRTQMLVYTSYNHQPFPHFLQLIEPYTQRDSYKGVTAIL